VAGAAISASVKLPRCWIISLVGSDYGFAPPVAAVEKTTSSPGRSAGIRGSAASRRQHGWQRPGPLVPPQCSLIKAVLSPRREMHEHSCISRTLSSTCTLHFLELGHVALPSFATTSCCFAKTARVRQLIAARTLAGISRSSGDPRTAIVGKLEHKKSFRDYRTPLHPSIRARRAVP
jgi:hypothetical protein